MRIGNFFKSDSKTTAVGKRPVRKPTTILQITSGNTFSVNEGVILNQTATANKTVTWGKVGTGAGQVTLDTTTGSWSLAAQNYDTTTSVNFTLIATDNLGASVNQLITVTILDVNNSDVTAPVITSSNTFSVNENVVLNQTATANEVVTWNKAGTGAGQVTLNATTGAWTLAAQDFEATASVTFILTATDAAGNVSTPQTITVTINNVAEGTGVPSTLDAPFDLTLTTPNLTYPPEFTVRLNETYDIAENPVIRLVGRDKFNVIIHNFAHTVTLAEATAVPPKSIFTGLSGVLTGTHRWTAFGQLPGEDPTANSNIITQGPDDIEPIISSADPSGTYPEMTAINGTLTANEAVTWSKTGTDAALVTLNASTGAWSIPAPDFETKPNYSFNFVATDAAGNVDTQAVALAITDVVEVAFSMTEIAAPAAVNKAYAAYGHNFIEQPLGVADPSRKILVAVLCQENPIGVSVRGVAAAMISTLQGNRFSVWMADVPVGTTGDIIVNASTNSQVVAIIATRVVGSTGIPVVNTLSPWEWRPSPQQIAVNTPVGGATAVYGDFNSSGTIVWANATVQSQTTILGQTLASAIRTVSGSGTISATGAGNTESSIHTVSFTS